MNLRDLDKLIDETDEVRFIAVASVIVLVCVAAFCWALVKAWP